MNRTLALLIAYAIVAATCTTVFAAPITQPGDLVPGDSYRLVFVTSSTRDATSSDIGDYNSFVAGVAAGESGLAALGTTWKAIGSTASVHALDNTDSNPAVDGTGVPIYRLDGTRIANNYPDLWDSSLIAPVATFEDGMATATFSNRVWTGTISSGFVNPSFPLGLPRTSSTGTLCQRLAGGLRPVSWRTPRFRTTCMPCRG